MDMPPVRVAPDGVERRDVVSGRQQITAILKKNAKVHMRTNACPCCTCCPFVLFSAGCLHLAFPLVFIFMVTAVPYIIVKATQNEEDQKAFLEVQIEKMVHHKPWSVVDLANSELSPMSMHYYKPASTYDPIPGGGLRSISDSLFAPPEFMPDSMSDKPYQFSCHCKTLAVIGGDSTVAQFMAFLDEQYSSWRATNQAQLDSWNASFSNKGGSGSQDGPEKGGSGSKDGRRLTPERKQATEDTRSSKLFQELQDLVADLPGLQDLGAAAEDMVSGGRRLQARSRSDAAKERIKNELEWASCKVDDMSYSKPLWRRFGSAGDISKWINNQDYGSYDRQRSLSSSTDRLCGAIVFENDPLSDAKPKYTIRMNVTAANGGGDYISAYLTKKSVEYSNMDTSQPFLWYAESGFLALQNLVHKFVAKRAPPQSGSYDLLAGDPAFVPMPVGHSNSWAFGSVVTGVIGFPLTLSLQFSPIVASLAYYLARERQTRQRELMRMMGLSDAALMWAWIALFAGMNLIVSGYTMGLTKIFLVRNSDAILLWLSFWFFLNAAGVFGMTVAAFVSSDKMAALGAILAFFASSWVVVGLPAYGSGGLKLGLSLLPSVGFLMTSATYFGLETNLEGLGSTWSTLQVEFNDYTVGNGLLMMMASFCFWLAIYYYADQVVPWHEVGVPRSPWFCVQPSYWRQLLGLAPKVEASAGPSGAEELKDSEVENLEFVEDDPDPRLAQMISENKCVLVKNLTKTFTNARGLKVNAVQNLNLTMYEGECFCLLGHNGAGKTTTMLMLTGCLSQTSGKMSVNGFDIPEQLREIRSSMGFCPQHNILWDELTVEEHIEFFGRIGGMSFDALRARGDELLLAVSLIDKKKARASALSGGMKRKLSCALAFLATPYLVILDEPSSGMDPFARRGMWETLKNWRAGHILCLTTHYMDEADALGDRIAIMSHGKLACSGSSTFLKKKFGCGYVISIAKVAQTGLSAANDRIMQEVRLFCPNAEIMSAIGKELLVQVPFADAASFSRLFPHLDSNLVSLGVESYGTSVTNLEEVFLKVVEKESASKFERQKSEIADEKEGEAAASSFGLQLTALLLRRFRYAVRNKTMMCCNLILPPACLLITCLLLTLVIVTSLPPLLLDTAKWNVKVESNKVPITVGTISGLPATATPTARQVYEVNKPPGVSQVHFEADLAGLTTAMPAYMDTTWTPLWANLEQEAAFLQKLWANAPLTESSTYGAILHPSISSSMPFNSSSPVGATIWANLSSLHAPAIMANAYASAVLSQRGAGITGLDVVNHPFGFTSYELGRTDFIVGIMAGVMVMAAFAFVPAGITSFVVLEKEKDVKHQLVISGCSIPAYWLSNLLFDVAVGVIPVIGALIVFSGYNVTSIVTEPGLSGAIALLLMFLPAAAGFSYLFSFAFSKAGTSLMVAWVLNLALGFLGQIIVQLVFSVTSGDQTIGLVIRWIFRLIPTYCLGNGFLRLAVNGPTAKANGVSTFSGTLTGNMKCSDPRPGSVSFVDRDCMYMIGDDFFFLCFDTLLYFGIAVGLDLLSTLPKFKQYFNRYVPLPPDHQTLEDHMVLAEKERVRNLDPSSQFVWVNNVRKVYGGKMHAVRGVSFACDEGQVFGLLGVNGAGKTSTFKMLCGQVPPTEGEVRIRGINVLTDVHKVRKLIGYCPQFDALLENLTTEEHLYMYGRLKGLTGPALATAVETNLVELDLLSFRMTRAGQLSGGNKRKLSVGMATISEPAMVFLDEPSAGMDPVARRFMWKVVQKISERRKKSVVILTTHSMDEAEALCSRIAIQVDGQFRCLGSAQQIKSLYGSGLELNIRLAPPLHEEIVAWCQAAGSTPAALVDIQGGAECMNRGLGEAPAQQLMARPGCILARGLAVLSLFQLAEWCLVEQRVTELEGFLHAELSAEINGQASLMVLEKSSTALRYRILPEVLQGRFKSLGALFALLQQNQAKHRMEDFQVSQASLEQIFNQFASKQIGQQAQDAARSQMSAANSAGAVTAGVPHVAQTAEVAPATLVGKPEEVVSEAL
ncbi:unnamed protein product [Polarella glacialis]|uniref:ABC transporter domain-containing protein n=1 Tax=Polarella glacialis TaxID=89957 RepID=A0A813LX18_POLGL|nr:unnamed protein product [Polarella glacialis]